MSDATTGMQPSRIPEFANLEEEAAFWDTHDTTDFGRCGVACVKCTRPG